MGSLNSDRNILAALLMIASIAAEFGSLVIELSNVALMTSAPPEAPTTGASATPALAPCSGAASTRTSLDAELTCSTRPSGKGAPPPCPRGVAPTLPTQAAAMASASARVRSPVTNVSGRLDGPCGCPSHRCAPYQQAQGRAFSYPPSRRVQAWPPVGSEVYANWRYHTLAPPPCTPSARSRRPSPGARPFRCRP